MWSGNCDWAVLGVHSSLPYTQTIQGLLLFQSAHELSSHRVSPEASGEG